MAEPSILVLLFCRLECGISRSRGRGIFNLNILLDFSPKRLLATLLARTVSKSQMAGFVPKLLNSESAKRGNHTYTKGQLWDPSSPGEVCGLLECAAGTVSFALFRSLLDGYDVKGGKKIKSTAVAVLFALWLIFHMLKIGEELCGRGFTPCQILTRVPVPSRGHGSRSASCPRHARV